MRIHHVAVALLCTLTGLDVWAADACALLKPDEIRAALGGEQGAFTASNVGALAMCRGQSGRYAVLIRSAASSKQTSTDAAKQGIEAMRKMGAQVDVKTEGDLTCMTLVAPAAAPQLGVNTTCTIARGGHLTGVEVTGPAGTPLAGMDVVRGLVEKAVGRL
jgi:hypothetical protein